MIIYFPGSFKPPHRGHFSIVQKLISSRSIEKIHIIISKKSRYCSTNNNSTKSLKEFTANQSLALWKFYINHFISDEEDKQKISVKISFFPSPVYQTYSEIARHSKSHPEQKYMIVKSEKDEPNTRFELFNKLKKTGVNIEYKVMKTLDNLSSRDFRCLIEKRSKTAYYFNKIKEFLPDCKWTPQMKKELLGIL